MKAVHPGVFDQLKDLSGSSLPIKNLLRSIQDRSQQAKNEINASGTKEEMIKNLRLAVERNYAENLEVYKLLWDLEETGKQHILLLTPVPEGFGNPGVNVESAQEVFNALFDEVDAEAIFPRYDYPSNGYVWADFRRPTPRDWLAKAYGRERYRQSIGIISTETSEDGTEQEIRQYEWKEVKTTSVVRWRRDLSVLELRIDITGIPNDKAVDERREQIWTLLSTAFSKSDFCGLNVERLFESLVFERHLPDNEKRFSISRVEFTDPRSGLIRVITNQAEAVDKEPGRRASLETMKKHRFSPSLVRVEWKCGLDDCPPCMTEPVSVVIEKTPNGPELRILKRLTNATYEYIFNQLRCRLQES